jgi:hypothetical protein
MDLYSNQSYASGFNSATTAGSVFSMDAMREAMQKMNAIMEGRAEKPKQWWEPNPMLPPHPSPGGAFSVPVYYHDLTIRKQVRFPRSKKIRIRRKWAKQAHNWQAFPDPAVYMVGGCLVGHRATVAKMATAIERINERADRSAF